MTINKWLTEKNIFYAVVAFGVLLLLTVEFYPSMDGPSHLYNSNLICHILKGDSSVINSYYTLNNAIIPNWTSYFILSLFNLFLPAWAAEKILLILYFTGIAISFRLLIKQLNPQTNGLSILIMPFAYSFLFHLGFYNYCLSFIFLFLSIYVWLKYYESDHLLKYILLFVLLLLTYLSAILTFFFLGFCLGLFIIAFSIKNYFNGTHYSLVIIKALKKLTFLLITAIPCLLFSIVFIKTTSYFPSNERYTTGELIKWLNDVRCIIVYDYAGEEKLTEQFLHLAIAIVSISLFIRFYNQGKKFTINSFRKSDLILIPTLLALLLLFKIPNGANAGMMSDRFCLLAYLFFIIWVSSQSLPQKVSRILILLMIIFHVGLLFKRQNGSIRNLNKDAVAVYNASKYIENNSIVLPVNMSDNWIEPHFSNYLGVDKPLVILENYEASVGWFPVKWNTQKLPCLKLGRFDTANGIHWPSNTQSTLIKQIDYVFLFGSTNRINNQNWMELKTVLTENYKLTFLSKDNYIAIYKKITVNKQ